MYEIVVYMFRIVGVFLGGESRETLVVEKNPQRLDTCDEDIYPEVKLEIVYKKWILNVTLDT